MTLVNLQGWEDETAEIGWAFAGGAAAARTVGLARSMASAQNMTYTLPSPLTSLVLGCAFRSTGVLDNTASFISLREGSVVHLALRATALGAIEVYRGTTLLATSAPCGMDAGLWRYVEIKCVITDVTGSFQVRVDEQLVLNLSSQDTRNGGASGVIDNILFTKPGGSNGVFDDFYLLDLTGSAPFNDFLGDKVVLMGLPNGNGDSSQWVGSDGNSTDNYLLIDDPTASMSDYIAASVSGNTDLSTMTDVSTAYAILAYQQLTQAAKSDAGTSPIVVPITKGQSGTIRSEAALPALSTTAQYFASAIRTTDPDGNALTPARINAMQLGVKIQ